MHVGRGAQEGSGSVMPLPRNYYFFLSRYGMFWCMHSVVKFTCLQQTKGLKTRCLCKDHLLESDDNLRHGNRTSCTLRHATYSSVFILIVQHQQLTRTHQEMTYRTWTFTQCARKLPEFAEITQNNGIMSFKVIQGHRFWYQSKAHIRFPISD